MTKLESILLSSVIALILMIALLWHDLNQAKMKIPSCPEYQTYRLGSTIYDENKRTLQCFYILELDSSWRKKK